MDEAEYCDRVALIYHGRMIALGSPRGTVEMDFMRDVHRVAEFLVIVAKQPHEAVVLALDLRPGDRAAQLRGLS